MQLKIALFWTLCSVLVNLSNSQDLSSSAERDTYDNLEDVSRDQHRFVGYRTTIFHESATFSNPTETDPDIIDTESTNADTSQKIDTTISENTDYPASETVLQEALITSNELTLKNETEEGEDSEDLQDINGEENESVTHTAVPTTVTVPTTTKLTTIHPSLKALNLRRKQTKQYRVYKSTGDGIVRSFLDDPYLRSPLAILMDTSPEPLRKAKLLWNATLRPASSIDLVLVAFNSSGTIKIFRNKKSPTKNHTHVQQQKTEYFPIRHSNGQNENER